MRGHQGFEKPAMVRHPKMQELMGDDEVLEGQATPSSNLKVWPDLWAEGRFPSKR